MPDDLRTHDLVLYGATGFVGELTAAHLAEHAPSDARIALAGRSRERLAAVRARLPGPARDWPLVHADATDPASLAALAGAARVVVTTVGPYAKYGLPLVEACARAGTHYADLTGEVLFVREAIDRYDALARGSGARIVHACGFDSIPSDLAVVLLHERAAADAAGGLRDVRLVATAGDRFALSPDRAAEPDTPQPSDFGHPARTADGRWTAPFAMAAFNTRVVRRSNALQEWAYGRELRYSEVMGSGRGPLGAVAAVGVAGGLLAFLAAMTVPPTRALLDRVLPAPGTGPSAATRERGWFRMAVDAATESGARYHAEIRGRGDPGYAATAVMLGQSGLALALDGDRLQDRAGSLTPATALGTVLVERLQAAGHTYEVAPA